MIYTFSFIGYQKGFLATNRKYCQFSAVDYVNFNPTVEQQKCAYHAIHNKFANIYCRPREIILVCADKIGENWKSQKKIDTVKKSVRLAFRSSEQKMNSIKTFPPAQNYAISNRYTAGRLYLKEEILIPLQCHLLILFWSLRKSLFFGCKYIFPL